LAKPAAARKGVSDNPRGGSDWSRALSSLHEPMLAGQGEMIFGQDVVAVGRPAHD
jgi:hypothetical protein